MPDIYQGAELSDLSMVDPDNRRPVDYGVRERMLGEGGTAKIAIIAAAAVEGGKSEHVCAFIRRRGEESPLVAAARFPAALEVNPGWCGTKIQGVPNHWRELLSDVEVDITDSGLDAEVAFRHMPVAVFYAPR